MTDTPAPDLVSLTADIVEAYVGNNKVPTDQVPSLIATIHEALRNTRHTPRTDVPQQETAVPIRASIKSDYLVCLEDGAKLKMLKPYLRTHYDMTPDEYRAKWNLPHDYPMVAPAYSAQRSALAKTLGLGRKSVADNVNVPALDGDAG